MTRQVFFVILNFKEFQMSQRRVVVTGLGCVSSVGNDVKTAWENVKNGKS